MEKELPIGWILIQLGDLFLIERGGSPRPIEDYITQAENGINWIKIGDTKGLTKYIYKTKEKIKPEGLYKSRMVYEDDFILSNSMSFGRPYIMKTSGCIHDGWLVIRPNKKIVDLNYLYYMLSSSFVYQQFSSLAKGSTVKNLNIVAVQQVYIYLPPLPEQQRIVAKLDTLFGHLDALKTRLDRIPQLLKDFRQKVLTQAVTGKLTEGWREGKEFNIEDEFLQIQKIKKKLQRSGEIKLQKLEPIKEEEIILKLFPIYWHLCVFDDLFSFIDYRGKTPTRTDSGVRLITAKNIKMGWLSDSPVEFMGEKVYKLWMTRGYPKINDLFFVTEGYTMGNVALNTFDFTFALAQRTLTLHPIYNIESKFYMYVILHSKYQILIDKNATGTAAKGIKAAKFKNLPVPFPPIEEQQEIVRRVESLFAKANLIEASYQKLKTKIEQLPQALLAKAFRGELVEQLPTDGNARELLEQIKLAKAGLEKGGRTKKIKENVEVRMVAEDGVRYGKK